MTDFITLTCPSCGGKLKLTKDINQFACSHCGAEHIVRRGDGIVSLSPVVQGLANIRVGVDKTASELAIVRLTQEIRALQKQMANVRFIPLSDHVSWKNLFLALGVIFVLFTVCNLPGSLNSLIGNSYSPNSIVFSISQFLVTITIGVFFLCTARYVWVRGETKQRRSNESNIVAQNIRSNLQKKLDEKMIELERHRKLVQHLT